MLKKLQPPDYAFTQFFKDELKKVYFAKGLDNNYYTMTKFLDKNTLLTRQLKTSIFTETTFEFLISIYLIKFRDK